MLFQLGVPEKEHASVTEANRDPGVAFNFSHLLEKYIASAANPKDNPTNTIVYSIDPHLIIH